MFMENNNKTSKGREGWELQNFRVVELLQLSNIAQRDRIFTRPFIAVRLLSEGKPRINAVSLN